MKKTNLPDRGYPIEEYVLKIVSTCNLACTYCYEYNLGDFSWKNASSLMSLQVGAKFIDRAIEHAKRHQLSKLHIGLHGGEPFLMKPDQLDLLIQLMVDACQEADLEVEFGVQTSATVLTTRHLEVCQNHRILVSVSLDGNRAANDRFRLDHSAQTSFDQVIDGINLLKAIAPNLLVGILSVIDIRNDPLETFEFIAQFGVSNIDFMLPLNNWDNPPFRVDPERAEYGEWYWQIYQAWIGGRHSHIDIRFLKNIITQLMGGQAIYEVMTLDPIGLLTINTDGEMEGVDTIKSSASGLQKTGLNVFDHSIDQALAHYIIQQRQIGIDALSQKCQQCCYLKNCAGGYYPHRYSLANQFSNESVFCLDLYWLIEMIHSDLMQRASINASS